jgi:hypothetical protein
MIRPPSQCRRCVHGDGANHPFRLALGLRPRLHLCAVEYDRVVEPAAPHPEAGGRAQKPDAHLGGSVGISVHVALLAENTQTVHSRVVEQLRPDNPLAQALYLAAPFSLTNPAGIAALNAEVTRQPAMVAYLNDIALVMIMALGSCIQLLLVRPPPLPTPKPAMPIWRRRLPRPHIADPNKSARSAVAQCAS